jgi:hypothetical protein
MQTKSKIDRLTRSPHQPAFIIFSNSINYKNGKQKKKEGKKRKVQQVEKKKIF